MKVIKAKGGKTRIVVSKKEWDAIGEQNGWFKKAQTLNQDNVNALVDAAQKGYDINAFKSNPFNGQPITPEEIAQAQQQLGIQPQSAQSAPQAIAPQAVAKAKGNTKKASDTKKKLKAEEK